MHLPNVPEDLLPFVIEKMTPVAFSRFRRTTKQIDKFIEEKRFRWSFQVPKKVLVMLIVGSGPKAAHCFIANQKSEVTSDFCREQFLYPERLKIEDPYKQLSSFSFCTIYFGTNRYSNYDGLDPLPVLSRLRLSCEILCVSLFPVELLQEAIPLFRFSKFFFDKSSYDLHLLMADVDNSPIMHCSEVHLSCFMGGFNSDPQLLFNFWRKFPKCSFCFNYSMGDEHPVNLLKSYLQELRHDPDARGVLKDLRLFVVIFYFNVAATKLNGTDGLEEIWKAFVRHPIVDDSDAWTTERTDQWTVFYIMKIVRGTALVIHNQSLSIYNLFILDEDNDSREHILVALIPFMFPDRPVAFSGVFDDFMSTLSLQEAISTVFTNYNHDEDLL